ncbi:MAG: rane protein, partial [Segetibacter sp.]|nr:rane protein [Segetibacter sp.]
IAWSRIQQAQAYFEQSKLAFLPVLTADATVLAGKQSSKATNTTSNNPLYRLTTNASWEADIWGKLRSSKRASLASLLQSEAYSRAVQTSVVADIANYYYTLIGLDEQLQITEQSVKNWMTTV